MTSPDHTMAAILFSDIEGYTSMMQENEEQAIALVNQYQEELEKVVAMFDGKVMEHYGDGSLTIFGEAAQAVLCAYHLQKKLKQTIPLRMGIHYGRIVMHGNKVFGDTVNLASRVETLGKPGTVLFSEYVFKEIKGHPDLRAVSMGHYKFKNVQRKMEVFALTNDGLTVPKAGSLKGKLEPDKSYKLPVLVIALLGLGALAFIIAQLMQPPSNAPALPFNNNPSIAVLPFANLSADSTQEYFTDGLAQEVLILLTQDPQLRVTSRSSSFSFKGQGLAIPAIAEKLNVQYILDGSVLTYGDTVRISVQLVNALEDNQLWAQSWQRQLSDIFTVQQEIANAVKKALDVQIQHNQAKMLQQTNPQAYTLFLQARYVGQLGTVNSLKNAELLLENALQLDSLYAPAWAYLSMILNRQSNIGLRPSAEGHEMARAAAFRALSIDSTFAKAWSTLVSISIYYDRNFQMAKYYLEKASSKEPGSLDVLKLASNLSFCLGDIKQAIRLDEQSIEIDPVSAKNYLDLGYGYFFDGQHQKAEQVTRQGLLMNPGFIAGPFLLSLILMEQGKLVEAQQVAYTEPYEILQAQALSMILYKMKKLDSADYYLQEIKDDYANVAPYQIAQIYGHRYLADSAFKWLHLAYDHYDGGLVQMKADPFLRSLRSDPRWRRLLEKMDFP